MAEDADSAELYWFDPPNAPFFRSIDSTCQRGLRRTLRRWPYTITVNCAFDNVIRALRWPNPMRDRDKTWINAEIVALYSALHRQGSCAQYRGLAQRQTGRRALWRADRGRFLRREHVFPP